MDEENRIRLPQEVREEFDLELGTKLLIKVEPPHILELGTKLLIKAEPPHILLKPIDSKQDLLEYLDEIEKKEEPEEIDWDELIYSELEKD